MVSAVLLLMGLQTKLFGKLGDSSCNVFND